MSHWLRTIPVALPRELPSAALGGARLVRHPTGHYVLFAECPPSGRIISVAACVKTYNAGQYAPCRGCQLGPMRGAARVSPDRSDAPAPLRLVPRPARPGTGPRPQTMHAQPEGIAESARWLRQARVAAGMTQADLGLALGHKSGAIVSAWELGREEMSAEALAAAQALLRRDWPPLGEV